MTRHDFIYGITTWRELLDFCSEIDCDVCENIVSDDELDDRIADDFREYAYDYNWKDIRDWINRIPTDAAYYYRSGSFEYESADADFDDYKDDVLSWCDEEADVFDEEEDYDILCPFEDDLEDDPEESDLSDNDYSVEEFLGLRSPVIKP